MSNSELIWFNSKSYCALLMSDPHSSQRNDKRSWFKVPSVEELERAQEEEDDEGIEIYFDAKKKKLPDGEPKATLQIPLAYLISEQNLPSSTSSALPNLDFIRSKSAPGSTFDTPIMKPPPINPVKPASIGKYQPGKYASGSVNDRSTILVSERQKNNDVLKWLRNVKWQYSKELVPDFHLGPTQCALYLEMKFHQQKANYITDRIKQLPSNYLLRILLVLVDIDDHESVTLALNSLAIWNNMTLVLAFSRQEAAKYLETFKAYETKGGAENLIREKPKGDYLSQASSVLSSVRHISSSDVVNLLHNFGTISNVFLASMEQLAAVSGLGEKKVRRLYAAFRQPFIVSSVLIPSKQSSNSSPSSGTSSFASSASSSVHAAAPAAGIIALDESTTEK